MNRTSGSEVYFDADDKAGVRERRSCSCKECLG